jgi:hypothetical protein
MAEHANRGSNQTTDGFMVTLYEADEGKQSGTREAKTFSDVYYENHPHVTRVLTARARSQDDPARPSTSR